MQTDRRLFLHLTAAAAATPVLPACGGQEKTAVADVPMNPFDKDSTADPDDLERSPEQAGMEMS